MSDFFTRHADKIVTVSESGCWLWAGACTPKGYGIAFNGKVSLAGHKVPEGAHRLAYAAAIGPIPTGLHVCHRCDVPCCVNPHHLFLGTHHENLADMRAKGRQVCGETHGMALMDADMVRRLRAEHRFRNVTYQDLADKYGLTRSAVSAAVRRQSWRHVE